MQYTGERIVPLEQNGIDEQHLKYYLESIKHVYKGDDVLDIACGSGWGTEMLANHVRHVCGMDISEEAIEYAKKTYLRDSCNFSYGVGSILDIPYPDKTFSLVNSVETFEHVKHIYINELVKECHRVLKDGGLFIFTTPDFEVYPYHPTPKEYQGFHFWHYSKDELEEILSPIFKEVNYSKVYDSHFVVCKK